MRTSIRLAAISAAAAAAALLSGCGAGQVPMEAAPDANDPACANVIVRLPDEVAGLERRTTNAQATGAWGDPAAVMLSCGIEPSGPTTDRCVNVNDVDWIIDDSQAPVFRLEAYGRTPGLQVIVDNEVVSGTEVMLALGGVVTQLPQERRCLSLDDTLELDG